MACIEFQTRFGCSAIILPSPLVTAREGEGQAQGEWLDASLEATASLDLAQPLLATIAISDVVLNEEVFEPGGFLDTLVDQTVARNGVDGVYIVVAASQRDTHPLESAMIGQRAYLKLSNSFGQHYDTVVVNFADVFGVVCCGQQATGFATGPSRTLRRLCLAAMEDEQYGYALPFFYSHRIVAELRTEADLDQIVSSRLLRRVADRTTHSADLLAKLRDGGSASELPAWAESRNNVAASQKHFLARMAKEGRVLRRLSQSERVDYVREWLEEADASSQYVRSRLPNKPHGVLAPVNAWLDLFDELA